MVVAALSIAVALLPQPAVSSPEKPNVTAELIGEEVSQFKSQDDRASIIYNNLLQAYKPKTLQRAQILPRTPVETPPTEYLPYPPPPNYVWPPGPHTQYPPPSETNAPAGWYGGTGTGGQGNSGAGSASNVNSASGSTSSAPSLRIPTPLRLPINLLFTYLPTSLLAPLGSPPLSARRPQSNRKASSSSQLQQDHKYIPEKALEVRAPVETPPTEYLPYPPPPNYQWPPGMTPQNENPQPSEFNPPPGWNTGQTNQGGQGSGSGGNSNGNGNTNAGNGAGSAYPAQNPYPQQQVGGGGGGIGKGHLAWILIVTIIATGVVVGGLAYRQGKKKGAGGGGDDGGEKAARVKGAMAKMRFWGKKKGRPPPAAAAADEEAPAAE